MEPLDRFRMGKIGPHRTFQCPVARDNVIVERVVERVFHGLKGGNCPRNLRIRPHRLAGKFTLRIR